MSSSSVASARSSPLAGKTFFLRSVTPEPPAGPFPARILAGVHIKFAAESNRVGFSGGINSALGSYELGDEGGSIRFTGASWTERGLHGLAGDDAEGTLARRCREAEGLLQQKISWKGDWFGLSLLDEGHTLVLKDNQDGAQYVFSAADQGTADGRQTD